MFLYCSLIVLACAVVHVNAQSYAPTFSEQQPVGRAGTDADPNNAPSTIWKVAGNGIDCLYYRLPNVKLAIRRDAQTRQVLVSTSTECAKACNAEQGCQSFEYNWKRHCRINAGDLFSLGTQPDWTAEEGSDFYQLRDCVQKTTDGSGAGNEQIIIRTTNANTPSASVLLSIIGSGAAAQIDDQQIQQQQAGDGQQQSQSTAQSNADTNNDVPPPRLQPVNDQVLDSTNSQQQGPLDFNQQRTNDKPQVSISRPNGGPLRIEIQRNKQQSQQPQQRQQQLRSRLLVPSDANNGNYQQQPQLHQQVDNQQDLSNDQQLQQPQSASSSFAGGLQQQNVDSDQHVQSPPQIDNDQLEQPVRPQQQRLSRRPQQRILQPAIPPTAEGQYASDVQYGNNNQLGTAQVSTDNFPQANTDQEMPDPSRFAFQRLPAQPPQRFQSKQKPSFRASQQTFQQQQPLDTGAIDNSAQPDEDFARQQQQFQRRSSKQAFRDQNQASDYDSQQRFQPRSSSSSSQQAFRDQNEGNDYDSSQQPQQQIQRSNPFPLRRRNAQLVSNGLGNQQRTDFGARAVENQARAAAATQQNSQQNQQQQQTGGVSNDLAFVLTRSPQNMPVVADINAVSGNRGTSLAHTRLDEGVLGTPLIRTRARSLRKGTSDARSLGFSGFGGKNRIESHAEAGEEGVSNAISRSHTSIAGSSDTLSNATTGLRGVSNSNAYSFSNVGGTSSARSLSQTGDHGVANSYVHTVTGLGGINKLQASAVSGDGGVSLASGYGGRSKFDIDATLGVIRSIGNGGLGNSAVDDASENARRLNQEQFESQPNVPAQIKVSK